MLLKSVRNAVFLLLVQNSVFTIDVKNGKQIKQVLFLSFMHLLI